MLREIVSQLRTSLSNVPVDECVGEVEVRARVVFHMMLGTGFCSH